MKLEKLRLKGFTGIKRGLGLDEITIDFTTLSGLTALAGENGIGKSSVLESLSPYNQLASRDGALYQHTYMRDSEKELSFTYSGHHFRTLLKIDCQSGRSEGFVWRDGNPEVNGKISEYAKYIEKLLGSPTLFFASVFCAQNAKKISEMTTGQLKGLFAEFLRLERYERWADTAKQAGNILQGKAGQFDTRIATLQGVTANKETVGLAYCEAGGKAEGLRDNKTILEQSLVEKRQEAAHLKEIIFGNTANLAQKRDIQQQIERLDGELAKEKTAAETEINALAVKYMELKEGTNKTNAILADREKIEKAAETQLDLENILIVLQAEIDRLAEEGIKHQAKVHEIETVIAKLKADRKALDNDPQVIEAEKELTDLTFKLTGAKQALENLKNDKTLQMADGRIIVAKEKMKSLDLKDPACQSSTCDFIVEALKAKASLPELEATRELVSRQLELKTSEALAGIEAAQAAVEDATGMLDNRRKTVKVFQDGIDAKINDGCGLRNAQQIALSNSELLAMKRQLITKNRNEIAQQKALADKLPEVQIAEARKADLEKQLAEVMERGQEKKAAWIDRETALKTMLQSERDRLDAITIDFEAEEKLKEATIAIEVIEKIDLPRIEKEIQAAREKIATLQAERKRIEEAEKELEEVRHKKDLLMRDVSEWRYLQNACGKNGLQALEIDATAPLITGFANKLLSQTFGQLFSVKMITQDEEGKECLDIIVIGEDGSEDLLENKSGGEKIWVLMALRLAMTLLSKEKSGHSFASAFSDESDGPLDPENSINYVSMYRAFMAEGAFDDFYFISHKPECRAMADNTLAFERGKNPFWK
jgi:exonuclease SbcC